MNKYKNILIDTNNVFLSHFKYLAKSTTLDEKTLLNTTIESVFKAFLKYEKNYLLEGGSIYLLVDNPTSKSNIRKIIYPDYKSNRGKENDGVYRAIDFLLLLFKNYSSTYKICRIIDAEADDLVFPLLSIFDKYDKNLLISEDSDWARCIGNNTDWFAKDKIFNSNLFKETFGYYPSISSVCIYKAIRGDHNDNIPVGLPLLPESEVIRISEKYENIYQVYRDASSGISGLSKNWEEKLCNFETQSIISRNFELVSFRNISVTDIIRNTVNGKFKKDSLKLLYESFGINYKQLDSRLSEENKKDLFGFEPIERK